MNAAKRLKQSQKQHLRIWRETLHKGGHDAVEHSYHASIIQLQLKKGRKASTAEKRSAYRKSRKGRS